MGFRLRAGVRIITCMTSGGSFARWQSQTMAQLGYAVGLILAFGTASLGFALTLLKDQDVASSHWFKLLMLAIVALLLISIGLGLGCVVNRLLDFRKTTRIVRLREQLGNSRRTVRNLDGRLRKYRVQSIRYGRRTWSLFRWQTITFSLAILLIVMRFVIAYHEKLF